jgi:hypothetical protein
LSTVEFLADRPAHPGAMCGQLVAVQTAWLTCQQAHC